MDYIPVLVVDDDKILLDDITSMYDWQGGGFQVVATAVNGVQALTLFRQFHPQLVITDIVMPGMNGIDLLREIRALDHSVHVILLTSYDEFCYAKQGLQYAANDYLLKSEISPETLSRKMESIAEELRKEIEFTSFLKQNVIGELFHSGRLSIPSSTQRDQTLRAFVEKSYYHIILELPSSIRSGLPEMAVDEVMKNILDLPYAAEILPVAAVPVSARHILLVLQFSDAKSQLAARNYLYRFCRKLLDRLESILHHGACLLFSETMQPLTDFYSVYASLGIPERHFRQLSAGSLIVEVSSLAPGRKTPDPDADPSAMVSLLEEGNLFELRTLFDLAIFFLEKCDGLDPFPELAGRLFHSIDQMVYSRRFEHPSFPTVYSYAEFFAWCISAAEEALAADKGSAPDTSALIKRAIEFIYQNYSDIRLGTSMLAGFSYLSVGYLCTLFKQETGKSVKKFITDVRIGKAKKLLQDPTRRISDIAALVGYSSGQYFSQIFQKCTGLAPKEYQRHMNHE